MKHLYDQTALELMAEKLGLKSVPTHWQGRTFSDVYSELTDAMCLTREKLGQLHIDAHGNAKKITGQAVGQKIKPPVNIKNIQALCNTLTTPIRKSLYAIVDSDESEPWKEELEDTLDPPLSPLEQARKQGLLNADMKAAHIKQKYPSQEIGACAQAVREYRGLPLKIYEKVGITEQHGNGYEKQSSNHVVSFHEKRASIAKLLGCGDQGIEPDDSHIEAMIELGNRLRALNTNSLRTGIAALIEAKSQTGNTPKDRLLVNVAAFATTLYPKTYEEYRRDDGYSPALITQKDIRDYLAGIKHESFKIFTFSRVERTAQALGMKDIFALEELGKLLEAGIVTGFAFEGDKPIPQFKEGVSQEEKDAALKFNRWGVMGEEQSYTDRLARERQESGPHIRGLS